MISILAVLLVLFMAAGVAEEGGERIREQWMYSGDFPEEGELRQSGQWMYVLEDGGAAIWACTGYLEGDLAIPAKLDGYPVTGISSMAFQRCEEITSVAIPEGVRYIGEAAFDGCLSLARVTLPNSLTDIAQNAFRSCGSLKRMTLPEGLISIEQDAFIGSGLTSIMIPASVTSIEANPFIGCPLERVDVSLGNPAYEQIGGALFDKREKKLVAYPAARKGAYAIPDGTLLIASRAFESCEALTGITIPNGVTGIGDSAFDGCAGLTGVTLPDSVTSIGEKAFRGCVGLTNATLSANLTSIGASAFFGCKGLTGVIIPDSVTDIGHSAFLGCEGLTSVNIPHGVTSITSSTFSKCGGLTSVIIPDSVTSIGYGAFSECGGLTSVIIPDGVTSIGNWAFYRCDALTSVILPDSLTSIGGNAFFCCSSLTSLMIPSSVISIGDGAFQIGENAFLGYMDLVLSVEEGSYAEQYAEERKIPYVYAVGKTGVARTLPTHTLEDESPGNEGEAKTGTGGHWTYTLEDGGATITGYIEAPSDDLVIPDELDGHPVTGIGENAFADCTWIASVAIPTSVTEIGTEAFARCFGLTNVAIPDSVTAIGEWAFKDCTSLTGLTIGSNVTSIGALAFFACESLTEVIIPDTVMSIGSLAFADCHSLRSVTIPAGVTSISNNAFQISPGLADLYVRDAFTFRVTKGSFAEQYAIDNDIPYTIAFTELPSLDDDGFVQERSMYDDDWDDDDWVDDSWWFDDGPGDDDWLNAVYPGMFDDGWTPFYGVLNQRMATRTGPGTKFTEDHGTLPESTEIVIYAQEDSGGTPWVLVEFVRNGKLVRAYTGLKRVDVEVSDLPKTTKNPKAAIVTEDTPAFYGPDAQYYMAIETPVRAGTELLVYGVDRNFALVEYAREDGTWMRAWVPMPVMSIH